MILQEPDIPILVEQDGSVLSEKKTKSEHLLGGRHIHTLSQPQLKNLLLSLGRGGQEKGGGN